MSDIWEITDYQQKHPEVTVLDPPCAIQRIYNRQSMLQGIADINLADCDDTTSSANEVAEEWWAWERITKLTEGLRLFNIDMIREHGRAETCFMSFTSLAIMLSMILPLNCSRVWKRCRIMSRYSSISSLSLAQDFFLKSSASEA
ncbi:unnamed protein product [Arabidopsis thaliana]|uniref:Uncharacterized protein n=1 Tax=Arabidopsis thaliana TaxID=3702 RepID=A0A654EU78_ARATH|nr:unnamed protein product [Arabidopsis thaliana]